MKVRIKMAVQMMKCDKCGKFYNAAVDLKCPFCVENENMLDAVIFEEKEPEIEVDEKTEIEAEVETELDIDPVVGWLVGLNGSKKGYDYKIRYGQNFVGRAENMDICIEDDMTMAYENQAKIVCDEKNQKFYIVSGEGRSVNYVNEEIVLSQLEINPYDILEIGATKLIFVPLCGENFSWKEI